MDKRGVQQNSSKHTKAKKKKQIKVVYISNPMRFKTTASEFKGLVQQFTGQDSDVADLSKFTDVQNFDNSSTAVDRVFGFTDDDSTALSQPVAGTINQQQQQPHHPEPYKYNEMPLDAFDEVFSTQMLENLSTFMSSSLYYESPAPPVNSIQRLDAA
uniref:Glutamate-1-semialdehyde 2,1-aminomutase n=1 Tax=Anthurium amnicola TaxID=1678845 RepID=A0A1D1YU55_9ARAE